MKLLVLTNSCSAKKYEEVCGLRHKAIVDPQQKFFRLFIDGLSNLDKVEVEVLSALPVSASTIQQKNFAYESEITDTGAKYHYLPFKNGKFSRYLTLIHAVREYAHKWIRALKDEDAYVIVDALVPVLTVPCKNLFRKKGIKVGAIVTDIPTLATGMKQHKESLLKRSLMSVYQKVADKDLKDYDFYIPLTESINDVVNQKNRPYCVVEGFADSTDTTVSETHENYIMYAGGVYEKYGVKDLIEAFILLNRTDVVLKIFGDGSYVEELKSICAQYPNVQYMGCVLPEQVVEYEKKALLLVNPRPTNEEFAKYSFPSKTMEYLLSGTAVVSTKLPGIPIEYFDYIYSFSGCTPEIMYQDLLRVLRHSPEELIIKGKKGHDFVLKNKNNIVMTQKIVNFLRERI